MRVRFAVGPDRGWLSAAAWLDFAVAIETAGFDGLWLSGLPVAPTLDPLLGIALLAGRTSRLRLGANVVPLGRNPFVLAKRLAQLDQVSDGRLLLAFVPGVDQLGEREALGIAGATRGELLERALGIARGLRARRRPPATDKQRRRARFARQDRLAGPRGPVALREERFSERAAALASRPNLLRSAILQRTDIERVKGGEASSRDPPGGSRTLRWRGGSAV